MFKRPKCEEIVNAILFLISEQASYINGQTLLMEEIC